LSRPPVEPNEGPIRCRSTAGLTCAQLTELIARCWQVHPGRQSGDLGGRIDGLDHDPAQPRSATDRGPVRRLPGHGLACLGHLLPIVSHVTALDRSRLADALPRGLVLPDGTPIPTGDRAGTSTTNYTKKHHKQARGLQVAAFRDGRLADVSIPVRGSRHDSRDLEEVGWADQITQACLSARSLRTPLTSSTPA
jgi:hypothetical protein